MCDDYACGRAGRYTRSICITGRHLGHKNVAVIEKWPPNGFLKYYSEWRCSWTKVNGRYREGGCLSGVAVKRGSTVMSDLTEKQSFLLRGDLASSELPRGHTSRKTNVRLV